MDRLWQPATVISASEGVVQLRFDQLSQCERCLRGEGCGAGVFSQLFARNSTTLDLKSDIDWRCGQKVRVGLAPDQLVSGSLTLYGLPLAGFIAGAIAGSSLTQLPLNSDLSALLFGVFGAAATTWISWRRMQNARNPEIEALSCDSGRDEA